MDIDTEQMPRHLDPLMQPTPSGVAKLLAAWDGLSVETQIAILTRLEKHVEYLARSVRIKALASSNAYVRYLAATGVRQNLNPDNAADREISDRIANDPDPLVRYSGEEIWWPAHLDSPDRFWALAHEARLAQVRGLRGGGKEVARIISYALDHPMKDDGGAPGKPMPSTRWLPGRSANPKPPGVPENELEEVLDDYLLRPNVLDDKEDIGALWRLVPKLSPKLADGVIRALPGRWLAEDIPREVLDALTEHQLGTLLFRPDVIQRDLRRNTFRASGKDRGRLLAAAVSSHFSIEDSEFAEVLAMPEEERIAVLETLATYASDLRLCVYEALSDYMTKDWFRLENEHAEFDAERSKEERLSKLRPGSDRDDEVLQLRLYWLARRAVPIFTGEQSDPPDEELEFLAKHIVEGDTWGTFMAFASQWRSTPNSKVLEQYLPPIYEVDSVADESDPDAHEL